MLLNRCQSKFAFSKANWYALALKANLPRRLPIPILARYQQRETAQLAALLDLPIPNDNIESSTIALPQTLIPSSKQPEPSKYTPMTHSKISQRCSGFNKSNGQQCRVSVRVDPSLPPPEHILCFRHRPSTKDTCTDDNESLKVPYKTQCKEAGNTVNASSKLYNCWHLWIGENIGDKQRALIRKEMQKSISKNEEPGYIYAYSHNTGPTVSEQAYAYFKIGRTKNPHRRMYEIARKCKYVPRIIELFPSFPVSSDASRMQTNLETLKHGLAELPKCPMSHRVERLIHLEMSSLYQKASFICPICGLRHREWFRVERPKHPDGSLMTDKELWLSNIRPVILRWIQFGVLASELKET